MLFRSPGSSRFRADRLAVAVFLVAVIFVMVPRWYYDNWLTEYDIFTFFLPWYGMGGDRLRDLDIPGWTPYFLSGTPLAGDASAGWMYAPVMLAFSLLSVTTAFKMMILVQVVIGGLSTYALSRVLGFAPIAALAATTAFAFGPYLAGQTDYTTIGGQVSTWIPVALLGIELSLRAPRLISRIAWWSLSGFAISQIAVSWPGQGLIDALLIVAGWVFYRAVLSPPFTNQSPINAPSPTAKSGRRTLFGVASPEIRRRVFWAAITGIAVVGIGMALGAAGILPRLD
ncbi:MAG: hypothetical protein ACR2OU_10100, partial [Thermomicrobiales bacterium]